MRTFLRSVILGIPVLTSAAMAQQQPPPQAETSLEAITVTAQKRAENLQNVPITIAAFTGAQLQDAGVKDTTSLQMVTPGVVFGSVADDSEFYIRGIGSDNTTPSAESAAAIYVDGVYRSDSITAVSMLQNIERIEILKGPQGTLYGRNSTGGAINILPKSPTSATEASVSVTAGNFNDKEWSAYLSGGSDTLMANIAVGGQKRGGYITNFSVGSAAYDRYGDRLGDLDESGVRGKVRWLPAEHIDVTLALDYAKKSGTDGSAFQQAFPVNPAIVNAAGQPVISTGQLFGGHSTTQPWTTYAAYPNLNNDWIQKGVSLTGRIALDGMDFASISSYRRTDVDAATDADASGAVGPFGYIVGFQGPNARREWSQEFQLLSNDAGRLKWVTGLYYFGNRVGYDPLSVSAFSFTPVEVLQLDSIDANFAAYAEGTYHFNDTWDVTLGARYTRDRKALAEGGTVSVPGVPTPFSIPTDHHAWQAGTPRISVNYHRPEGMYYLTVSSGFKAGSYNLSAPNFTTDPAHPPSNSPVNPEKVIAAELGAKWTLADDRARVNADVFEYKYRDIQVTVLNALGAFLENAARSTIKGAEADLAAVLAPGLTLRVGGAFLHSVYDQFSNASVYIPNTAQSFTNPSAYNSGSADLSGYTPPRSPDFSSTTGLEYTVPIPAIRGSMTFVGNWYYSSKYFLSSDDSIVVNSYSLLGARIAYRTDDKHATIAIWGNNLADKAYINGALDSQFGRIQEWNVPRTFGLTVGYDF